MKLLALGILLAGGWLLLRRGGGPDLRVVVAWRDGSELSFRPGTAEAERLTAIAREVVR